MRRRSFVLGGLVASIGAGFGFWRWIRLEVSIHSEPTPEPSFASEPDHLFNPDASLLLLAVANVIVPADAEAAGASEVQFVSALERWVRVSPEREQIYAAWWPLFERALRTRVSFQANQPEPEMLERTLESWHREYSLPGASIPARFFEQLRRDTLRVYYASSEGWASVGYRGPARLARLAPGSGVSAP